MMYFLANIDIIPLQDLISCYSLFQYNDNFSVVTLLTSLVYHSCFLTHIPILFIQLIGKGDNRFFHVMRIIVELFLDELTMWCFTNQSTTYLRVEVDEDHKVHTFRSHSKWSLQVFIFRIIWGQ